MKISDADLHFMSRCGPPGVRSIAAELLLARRALRFELTDADREARMRTLSGWLHPLAPRPGEIQIWDIARGIAATYRYRGQTDQLYTVAEHSVLVSLYVAPEFARQALLHDAAEGYLADIVGPVKITTPMRGFCAVEDRLAAAIYATFGVTPTAESNAAVHAIDKRVCSDEMPRLLRPGRLLADADLVHAAHMQACRAKYGEPLGAAIPCLPPAQAERLFIARFAELFAEQLA